MSLIMDNFVPSDNQDELKIDELKELVKNLTIKNQELEEQVRGSNESTPVKSCEQNENDSLNERNNCNNQSSNQDSEQTEIIKINSNTLQLDDQEAWLMESSDRNHDARNLMDWLALDLYNRDNSVNFQLLARLRDIARGISSSSPPPPLNTSFVDTRTFTRKRRQESYSRGSILNSNCTFRREESIEDDRLSSASDSSNTFQEIQHAARLQEESLKSTKSALRDSGLGRDIGIDGASSSQSDLDRAAYPASVDGSLHSSSPPDSPYSSQSLDQPPSALSVAPKRSQEALRGSLPNLSIQRGLSRLQAPRGMARKPQTTSVQLPPVRRAPPSHKPQMHAPSTTTARRNMGPVQTRRPSTKTNIGVAGTQATGLRRPSAYRPHSAKTQDHHPPPAVAPVVAPSSASSQRSNIPSRLPRAPVKGGIPRPTSSKLQAPKVRAPLTKYRESGVDEDWRDGCF